MSGLPITQKDYRQSILITELICAVKRAQESGYISDAHFSPVTDGYDISFKIASSEIKFYARCRRFCNGCVVKMFTDGRKAGKFVLKTKSDIDYCINKIKK